MTYRRPWSNAKRTDCAGGHIHASKMEAKVCNRLSLECAAEGWTLFQQPRFPLLSIAPKDTGKPEVYTPDFAIWAAGKLQRIVEAKGRVSRDFTLRKAAFESSFGVPVEVVIK